MMSKLTARLSSKQLFTPRKFSTVIAKNFAATHYNVIGTAGNANKLTPLSIFTSGKISVQSRCFSEKANLKELLNEEILEEESAELDDQELNDAKKRVLKYFLMDDEPGLGEVNLTRKNGDETITVCFDCQNTEEVDNDEGSDEFGNVAGFREEDAYNEDGDNDEEGDVINFSGINFEVKVEKKGNVLHFEMLAGESLEIKNVRYIPQTLAEAEEITLYAGPKFFDLNEDVQAAFYDYLADRKVDDDLSFFILAFSRDKEQREYVNWLNEINKFVI